MEVCLKFKQDIKNTDTRYLLEGAVAVNVQVSAAGGKQKEKFMLVVLFKSGIYSCHSVCRCVYLL